jgi:hypothetical protein
MISMSDSPPTRRLIRPSALKRLKDTYRTKDIILPALERHVMKSIKENAERSDDWLHPSDMAKADWCGRHDYYRIVGTSKEKTSKANPSFRMENVFAEGHTIHGKYQTWLWEMGVLWGEFQCLECGHRWGALSPEKCQFCLSERLRYREAPLRRNRHMVEGHADAAVHGLNGWSGLVEIKSIGVRTWAFDAPRLYQRYLNGESAELLWRDIQRPFASHMRQGQLYLWMTWPRYEEICFIYESKFHQQTKEFVVGYNKKFIAPILETALEVAQGVRAGITPDRPHWATDPEGKICSSCEYRGTCWSTNGYAEKKDDSPPVLVKRGSAYRRKRAFRTA